MSTSKVDLPTSSITVKRLREECPSYVWIARRCGMTYEYDGKHPTEPHKNVRVYSRASLHDDASHVFVETSIDTLTYAEWKSRYKIEMETEHASCAASPR